MVSPGVKNPPANAGNEGSVPGLGRFPGVENGNSPQYSCLENSADKEAWRATVRGVTKESDTTKCARAHTHTHTHTHRRMNRNSPDILGKGQTCANPLKPEGNDESWKSGKKMDMAGLQDLGFELRKSLEKP